MEQISTELRKMSAEAGSTVQYSIRDKAGNAHAVNDWIGKKVSIAFSGTIHCVGCGKTTRKSFAQGYCYNCFQTHPDTEECVLRPELCKAHLGIARDLEVATKNHLAPHYVYLSYTSNIKVGITRETQVPTRWIDQGALAAIKLLKVPNRHIAGVAEVFLKNYYSDKSAWQRMLASTDVDTDLLSEKESLREKLSSELLQYWSDDDEVTMLQFPTGDLASSVKSLNLDKTPTIGGVLTGVKGQYLIFDQQNVINVRKYSGYEVNITVQ